MSVNADPQELEKFSQLAHRWWDPNSEFKPLHDINPLRLRWIDASAGLAGKRVLVPYDRYPRQARIDRSEELKPLSHYGWLV